LKGKSGEKKTASLLAFKSRFVGKEYEGEDTQPEKQKRRKIPTKKRKPPC